MVNFLICGKSIKKRTGFTGPIRFMLMILREKNLNCFFFRENIV